MSSAWTSSLDPRKDVRSLDDLKAFLEKLKAYVDTRDDIRYVFDTGWHPRAIGRWIIESWTYPLGQSKAQVRDVYA